MSYFSFIFIHNTDTFNLSFTKISAKLVVIYVKKLMKLHSLYLITLIKPCTHIILNEFPVNYINHNCYEFHLRNDIQIGKVFNIRKLIIINFTRNTNPYNGLRLEVSIMDRYDILLLFCMKLVYSYWFSHSVSLIWV